jgi:hypothetical protein
MPWRGQMQGANWKGTIDMNSGYGYTIWLRPVGDIHDVPSTPKGAAYYGQITAHAPGTGQWSTYIAPQQRSTYRFSLASFPGGDKGIFSGRFEQFEYDKETNKFSSEVAFDNHPWKGLLEGKNWMGTINMTNGWKYDIALIPIFIANRISIESGKAMGCLNTSATTLPVSQISDAYVGTCLSAGVNSAAFDLVVSYKKGSSYGFLATGYQGNDIAQNLVGELRDVKFDKRSNEFEADMVFDSESWQGKLKTTNWVGTVTMATGYSYSCSFKPSGQFCL